MSDKDIDTFIDGLIDQMYRLPWIVGKPYDEPLRVVSFQHMAMCGLDLGGERVGHEIDEYDDPEFIRKFATRLRQKASAAIDRVRESREKLSEMTA